MGHALIWLESLTAAVAAVGLVTAVASHRSLRWSRRLVAVAAVFGFLTPATAATVAVGQAYQAELTFAWQVRFVVSWTASLAAGTAFMLYAGLWRPDGSGEPAARAWPRGRLAAAAATAAALSVITVSNLDLALKVRLAGERGEAVARVAILLPPLVPDRDNAAPVYREAFTALRLSDPATMQQLNLWRNSGPTFDPRGSEVTDFLRARESGLAMLRRAAGMPGYNFARDYLWNEGSVGNEITPLRNAAAVLAFDARVRAMRGETRPALDDVAALFGMSRHLSEPVLLSALWSETIDSWAGQALQEVFASAAPAAADLAVVRPGDMSFQQSIRRCIELEEMSGPVASTLENLEHSSAPEPDWESGISRGFLDSALYRVFFLADDQAASRREVRAVLALAARPYWEARSEWDARQTASAHARNGFLRIYLSASWDRYVSDAVRFDARHQLARLAVAAGTFRAATGKLPERLDALVPAYLPAVPVDPFTGKPMRIRRDGPGVTLYSAGPYGKNDITFRLIDR